MSELLPAFSAGNRSGRRLTHCMQFNTPGFLLFFFPVFMLVYGLASPRAKLWVGISGSLLFYAWGSAVYLPLMVALTLAAYGLARGMYRWREQPASAGLFWLGLTLSVVLLVAARILWRERYPLGLSYVVFQVLAYLIETRRGPAPPESDLLRFSFYLLLFPKIPVGPIVRYSQVAAQIAGLHTTPAEMADGFRRFARGLAKKVLIADTLARVVDPVFALPLPTVLPTTAWLVLISYAVQLFFDFSGYADMAIGLGRMLGLRFVENFDFPYLANSMADFWRRWHISLSSWFRDFVFYPLERRRLPRIGQQFNTLAVFLLLGLWHGFTRTLVVWGVFHGLAVGLESTIAGKWLARLWPPLRHAYVLAVVLVGWVFFRSPSLGYAVRFLSRLAGDDTGLRVMPFTATRPLPIIEPTFVMALAAGVLLCLPIGRWLRRGLRVATSHRAWLAVPAQVVHDGWIVLLLASCMAAIASLASAPAIYGGF